MARLALLALAFSFIHLAQAEPPAMPFSVGAATALKFGVHEIMLTGDGSVANPFDTVASVLFTPPSGAARAVTVVAFYDGGNTWRARTYVSEPGPWRWQTRCATDPQLDGTAGSFAAVDSTLRGRLLTHPKNPRQWMTEDGRWFLNINDTAYFLFCANDGNGDPVSHRDFQAYVRDAQAHGITSFRSWFYHGPRKFMGPDNSDRERWRDLFADDALSRIELSHQQFADLRLQWMLNNHPDLYLQLMLFPLGVPWRQDADFWSHLSAPQKDRVLRYLVARYAAYPQLWWLIVNDAHYAPDRLPSGNEDEVNARPLPTYPHNLAMAREIGRYFKQHDPWQHPLTTGHARTVPFRFARDDWPSYIQLEELYDLGAQAYTSHHRYAKPVFLGEDRYEQDRFDSDPTDMRYFQRRLYWAWLFSGASATYGGRWWVVHPYSETGRRPLQAPWKNSAHLYLTRLVGLDTVKFIRDYFSSRHIELSDYEPDHERVADADGGGSSRAPKLMRRRADDFLIYHPDAAADGREARADPTKAPGLILDLGGATGRYDVEWYRVTDGTSQRGDGIDGGGKRTLRSPWRGEDCVVRLSRVSAGARAEP